MPLYRAHRSGTLQRLALAVPLAVSLALAPRPAIAAPTPLDKASAQSLFEEALKLMAAKKFEQACPKLDESQRLDPGMGTEFRLAECYEAIGRSASAWAGFAEVADLARAAGQTDRERVAKARAANLEAKLAHLTIVVTAPETTGLEIHRGDVVLGKGQWGSAAPVDPGTYAVTATAPGKKPWAGSVSVAGDNMQASLTVPALEDAPAAPAAVVAVAPVAPLPALPENPPPPEPAHGGGRKVIGIVGLAAGVAAMGTSGVLGLVAKSQYDGAGAHCQGSICDASGKQTTDGARGLANAATVIFAAGAVVAVAGVVVWLTAPSASPGAQRASLGLGCGPGSLIFEGSF